MVATSILISQDVSLCLEIYCGLEYAKALFNDHNQMRKGEWDENDIYIPPVVFFTGASRDAGILDIVGGPYLEGLTPSRNIIEEKQSSA